MYISHLTLTDFRNYSYKELEFDNGTTVITGDNGVGKTNIVEAMSFLSSLRSHRTSQDNDMVKFNSPYCLILGEFVTNAGKEKLNILINSDNTKKIKYNNQEIKRVSDVVGKLNTVVFSPDTLEIIKEGPEKRRKFLDIAISKIDSKYCSALQMYKKILRQKNKHLKHFEGEDKYEVLDTYNDILARDGSYIEYKRNFFIDCLNDRIGEIYSKLTGREDDIYIDFEAQVKTADKDYEEIYDEYKKMLEDVKLEEIEKYRAVKGCHIDDIAFYLDRRNAKKFCSQGQQRILLLSMLFAQTEIALHETGERPIILLDDVLSELDEKRKKYVLEYISEFQTFITTANDESTFLPLIKKYNVIKISN